MLSHGVTLLNDEVVQALREQAISSGALRARTCLHESSESAVHEMLNLFMQGTYIRPHRHPEGKTESYIILSGKMRVCLFSDDGQLTDSLDLEARGGESGAPFIFHQQGGIWHMPIVVSSELLFVEIYQGPFNKPLDVEFSDWSPGDEDTAAVEVFLSSLSAGIE